MPIVTLNDVKRKEEKKVESFPVPQSWATSSSSNYQQQDQITTKFDSMPQQSTSEPVMEGVFWSWNLDQPPQWYHHILLCFCPCLVGPMCSDRRKSDYKRLLLCILLWISVIQIIYFIVELGVGGFAKPRDNPSLGPPTSALRKLGAKYAPDIKYRYHIHRLFVPIIMHAGFIHIIMNLSLQLLVCLAWERQWGLLRTFGIYLAAGVAGNLLSCCCLPSTISVGASGALLGLIGARISDITCRFHKLTNPVRVQVLISIAMLVLFGFVMSFTGPRIDWAAHLGGFLVGLFLGFAFFCNELPYRWLKVVSCITGLLLTTLFFTLCSVMFAVVVNVPKE